MKNFEELLLKLKSAKIQHTGDWEYDISNTDGLQEFKNLEYEELDSGLMIETHRWYETSVSVIRVFGKLLGIRHISNVFSESMGYEDCYEFLQFDEMKEVPTITYEKL